MIINVEPMPTFWCSDISKLSLGLQSGKDGLVKGIRTPDGFRFEAEVRVKTGRDGNPDFAGPLVHGRPSERFLYLSWGRPTTSGELEMFRRLKVYLSPVSRRGWSSEGISAELIASGTVVATVSGAGPDGTPHCGTAPIRWTGERRGDA